MFGRFFALELGCNSQDNVVYLNSDGSISQSPDQTSDNPDQTYQSPDQGYSDQTYPSPDQAPEGAAMICECRGLGCNKCKRKKAKVVTLTGDSRAVPVMNIQPMQLPLAPWTPSMIMMGRSSIF